MCYVIITCRSLGWTLLSISITLTIVAAVVSPHWMIGMPTEVPKSLDDNSTSTEEFKPTVGIFNRCRKLKSNDRENCATFVTSFFAANDDFPHAWKAVLVFFALAGLLLLVAMIFAVLSLFVRSICGKSIFTVSGLIQSIAGLLCVVALVVYPAGWGTRRIRKLCGAYADPYIIDGCELEVCDQSTGDAYSSMAPDPTSGYPEVRVCPVFTRFVYCLSFYLAIIGTVLIFVSSILSIQAEHSTTSRKVEEEVLEGKNLICVL